MVKKELVHKKTIERDNMIVVVTNTNDTAKGIIDTMGVPKLGVPVLKNWGMSKQLLKYVDWDAVKHAAIHMNVKRLVRMKPLMLQACRILLVEDDDLALYDQDWMGMIQWRNTHIITVSPSNITEIESLRDSEAIETSGDDIIIGDYTVSTLQADDEWIFKGRRSPFSDWVQIKIDGTAVGQAGFIKRTNGTARLTKAFVKEGFRNQGIYTALLQARLDILSGYTTIDVIGVSSVQSALLDNGFQIVEDFGNRAYLEK